VKRLMAALAAVGGSVTLVLLHGTSVVGGFPWADIARVLH
jgi:hypothetical protein